MKTKQNYLELLQETIDYYSEGNRRAEKDFSCMYFVEDTENMCAVGRCVKKPQQLEKVINYLNDKKEWNDTGVLPIFSYFNDVQNIFKDEYKGFDSMFWAHLQNLHDIMYHWKKDVETGREELTRIGLKKVEEIKEWINSNID